jgi:hypothetical protein
VQQSFRHSCASAPSNPCRLSSGSVDSGLIPRVVFANSGDFDTLNPLSRFFTAFPIRHCTVVPLWGFGGQLNALPHVYFQPIDLVLSQVPSGGLNPQGCLILRWDPFLLFSPILCPVVFRFALPWCSLNPHHKT